MLLATLAALSAEVLFALATALQHRSAGLVAAIAETPKVTTFLVRTSRHPLWAIGLATDSGGFALHALALRYGPLPLVQPLLVSSVIFALPLRSVLERRAPRRGEIGWAVPFALGLVLFLTIATPGSGAAQLPDTSPAVIWGLLVALGVTICFLVGRPAHGAPAAVLFGTGAGLSFAAVAGFLTQEMGLLGHGAGALALGWPAVALVAVGAAGFTLNQLAYRAGPLSFSLPALTTVDPVVSLFIGVSVFDERFRYGLGDLFGETLGLALVVVAAIDLTRSSCAAPRSGPPTPLRGPGTTVKVVPSG